MYMPSLVLYAPMMARIKHDALIANLEAINFIGQPVAQETYLSGKDFFKYLSFLGCAPNLALNPDESEQYLRIVTPQLAQPKLFFSPRAKPPLCLPCKAPIEDWKTSIDQTNKGSIQCQHCSEKSNIDALNLRKRACYTQHLIQIMPVFESEAVPTESLFSAFEKQLHYAFKLAYI